MTAQVARLGRIAQKMEAYSSNNTLEFLHGVRGELKATEAELLHWRVVLVQLTGSELPIDPEPVPKGEWVAETQTPARSTSET